MIKFIKFDNDKKKLYEPTKSQRSTHHINSLAYDYLSQLEENEMKKSQELTKQKKTKGKYGW